MDKNLLKTYAVWARENLMSQIEISLKLLGINSDADIKEARKVGDFTVIDGDPASYGADLFSKRNSIVNLVCEKGYANVIEEFAYTWFNRLAALRFMEVHNFLPHGLRVLSGSGGSKESELMRNFALVERELGLDTAYCLSLKEQNKSEELFRYLLIKQCAALSDILPMLFSRDKDYLELLLPKTLLVGDTVLTRLLDIPEENFLEDVEIIGWMYQFYISARKDAVNKAKKTITKETLPAVTQLFTPDWIVRYMAENSIGRIWLESYPESSLKDDMRYYVDEASQTAEVQEKLERIRYNRIDPEEIRVIEPCCGSGHILVYVFDLLFKMYEEKGYQKRDIPTLILKNNLCGLDVDMRAAQLSSFSLIMCARKANPQFFNSRYFVVPRVYEIHDSELLISMEYGKLLNSIRILSDEEKVLIHYLVDIFKDAKTIGSLLKVEPIDFTVLNEAFRKLDDDVEYDVFNMKLVTEGLPLLKKLVAQAEVLTEKYDVCITNPPYIGPSAMEAAVKDYAARNYPNSKSDMFAMFMETDFVKKNGFLAMINMHSWMFLSSYERLRETLLNSKEIITMAHLGARAFDEIGGEVVQTTSFVLRNVFMDGHIGSYCRLIEPGSERGKEEMFFSGQNRYSATQSNFSKIPGSPIAYWVSDALLRAFETGTPLSKIGQPRQGLATADNARFLRLWWEVEQSRMRLGCKNRDEARASGAKWFPCNKGGEFRKWYGNNDYVVNWQRDGEEMRNFPKSVIRNPTYYFRPGITWSGLSSSTIAFRYQPEGYIFDHAARSIFASRDMLPYLEGACNSPVILCIARMLSPTLNFEVGQVATYPIIINSEKRTEVCRLVDAARALSRADWDSYETSWDFAEHPLIRLSRQLWDATSIGAYMMHYYGKRPEVSCPLELCYLLWRGECNERFDKLKENEEELNRIFIDIYGLSDELTPDVADKDITVHRVYDTRDGVPESMRGSSYIRTKRDEIVSLISYLIGVVMGRYSLSTPGLAYAGGDWDPSKYTLYQPDDDGIVPIYRKIGMEDSLTARLTELIKLIYGEATYRANMDFIADALGKNSNESSEETLNRYLNDGFYSDHLKTYQKRPIYWLLSSGKEGGFKCLIYMHRYDEDTLARVNGKYFLPESTRLKNELEELDQRVNSSEGRDRIRLEKERKALYAAYSEAIEYGQVLDTMANRYITIDLDDGVKNNYQLFQGIDLTLDSGAKVKRDLLARIK